MATKPTQSTSANKATGATQPVEGDVEIVDATSDGQTGLAVADDAPRTPAVYRDDFDNELAPAHVPAPSITLVHGVGDYKNNHNPGQYVIGNLERAAELTKAHINKLKTPEAIRRDGRFKCVIVAISVPVWQPDVKPEHPGFKVEVPTKPNNGHLADIAAMGGTIDYKDKSKQLFVPKSEVTLLIQKPEHVSDEFNDLFPFVLDGQNWAMAKYYAKKSAFSNFVEPLRGQKRINPRIMDKKNADGTVSRGRWYGAPFLLGAKLVTTTANPSGFFVPDVVPCSDEVGPEVFNFAKDADPVKRDN